MALPSSGQLSFSQIGAAVGASSPYSLRSMSATAGFSTPDAVSEFYGFTLCKNYVITSTDPTYGADIFGTNCDGSSYYDYGFFGTVNLCFLENTISVSGGYFELVGNC
jgi:hypothetical protein